jgi:hypothetical protein
MKELDGRLDDTWDNLGGKLSLTMGDCGRRFLDQLELELKGSLSADHLDACGTLIRHQAEKRRRDLSHRIASAVAQRN